MKTGRRSFSRLRARARSGDQWAQSRLDSHIRRRLANRWTPQRVARTLGLPLSYVITYVPKDMRPRLVRRIDHETED
jgi:hypothetical protein